MSIILIMIIVDKREWWLLSNENDCILEYIDNTRL